MSHVKAMRGYKKKPTFRWAAFHVSLIVAHETTYANTFSKKVVSHIPQKGQQMNPAPMTCSEQLYSFVVLSQKQWMSTDRRGLTWLNASARSYSVLGFNNILSVR